MMVIYEQFKAVFDRFNEELFGEILGDKISDCVITLQRKSNTYSYMTFQSFLSLDKSDNKLHEICLNPEYFGVRPRIELLQSLVHEMTHVYQHSYGTVTKEGAHDEQFMDYMNAIGLMPSSNGLLDGKTTGGKKMFNYPLPDGRFLEVCNELSREGLLPKWFELAMPSKVSIDSIVAGLYNTHDLLGGLVELELLEVPILINKNIDVQSLLSCLTVDQETKKIDLDRSKASNLAEQAIKEDVEQESNDDGCYEEKKLSSTFDNHDDKPYVKSEPKPNFEKPKAQDIGYDNADHDDDNDPDTDDGYEDPIDGGSEEKSDNQLIEENFQVSSAPTPIDDLDEDDDAARFLRQAMANKPEKFERPETKDQSPRIVQSTDEIASILGLESAGEKKVAEKKKVRYKYECSCGKTIWGGLGLSVICGNCQLHFICETIERETGVVEE